METVAGGACGQVNPCWSCQGPVREGSLFCSTCKAVQPPGQLDHFARFGLRSEFELETGSLDRRYFDCQRLLHPDRFAMRGPREKALSQQQSVCVNEAYETLKDPLKRADYLVHLRGSGVLPEGCTLVNDQELLTETMELREALSEAESPEDVDILDQRAAADIQQCIDALSEVFRSDDLESACRLTTRLKYLRKLSEECRHHRARIEHRE
jgi:molecular chaperone HscB